MAGLTEGSEDSIVNGEGTLSIGTLSRGRFDFFNLPRRYHRHRVSRVQITLSRLSPS